MDPLIVALIVGLFGGIPLAYVTYQRNKQDRPGSDVDRLVKVADRLERDADRLEEERDQALRRVEELERKLTEEQQAARVRLETTKAALERERRLVAEKDLELRECRETVQTLRRVIKEKGLEDVA